MGIDVYFRKDNDGIHFLCDYGIGSNSSNFRFECIFTSLNEIICDDILVIYNNETEDELIKKNIEELILNVKFKNGFINISRSIIWGECDKCKFGMNIDYCESINKEDYFELINKTINQIKTFTDKEIIFFDENDVKFVVSDKYKEYDEDVTVEKDEEYDEDEKCK